MTRQTDRVSEPAGEICADDPLAADVQQLLNRHLAFAHTHSPPEDVFALPAAALADPAVTFFSFRRNGELLGVGALKQLGGQHGELKSMHTAEAARGQGIGRAMLSHLVGVARGRGYRRVSLETGTMAAFAPARAMYASAGFQRCEPFGDYRAGPNSVCMTMPLGAAG